MDLLTVEEIAKELKVNRETIRLFLRRGELAGIKIGKQWRVEKEEFDKFIAENRTKKMRSHEMAVNMGYRKAPDKEEGEEEGE